MSLPVALVWNKKLAVYQGYKCRRTTEEGLSTAILLGAPGRPPTIGNSLSPIITNHPDATIEFGFAYATLAGLDSCIEPIQNAANFQKVQKKWLVGVHHGITEPAALTKLLQMKNSETRLFSPTGKLDLPSLLYQEKFHAKFVRVAAKDQGLMIIGSANLTRNALSSDSTNYEACMTVQFNNGGADLSGYSGYAKWFKAIWDKSLLVTPRIIDEYAKVRARLIRREPHLLREFDEHSASHVGEADHLWIEAGAMSGGARNQIEFGEKLAEFFGRARAKQRLLRIAYGRRMYSDRPLSHKVTQWGTHIWRLGLPTEAKGGESYPGKIVQFTRKKDDEGAYWGLDSSLPSSAKARRWENSANRLGTVSTTPSTGPGREGRKYGLY